ncbi:MAG TPA: hypothetical protein VK717_07715 [Opitutaceae bacterium]|jgi:hypothetical protein|nr:hypothetical protein [Opitutaceae bacterium]
MSRYFQQLARHAGLAPSAPVPAGLPATAIPAVPHADITEEIVERDAVPTQPGVATAFASPPDSIAQPASNPPAEAGFSAHAQASEKISIPVLPEKDPAPSRSIPAEHTTKNPAAPGRSPVSTKPPATPDAATVIQQVIAWVSEPERARAAPSAASPASALPAGKSISSPVPSLTPAANTLPAVSQPATVKIMPASRKAPARPSPAPDKKDPAADQGTPARLEVMASPASPPRSRPGPPARTSAPRSDDSAQEFHVSIGSIHLTVETPPPAPPPRAPAPRPAPASTAPARTGGLPTSARRHYLRSFT